MIKMLVSIFLALNLIASQSLASGALAKKIAEQNKLELNSQDELIKELLTTTEAQLIKLKKDIETTNPTFDKITDWGVRLSLGTSVALLGIASFGRVAIDEVTLVGWSEAAVYIANAFALIDLIASQDVDPSEFNIAAEKTLEALRELKYRSSGAQREKMSVIVAEFEKVIATVDSEVRDEKVKDVIQSVSILFGATAITFLYTPKIRENVHIYLLLPTVVGSGIFSGAGLAYASFSGEDKDKILEAVNNTLEKIKFAKAELASTTQD